MVIWQRVAGDPGWEARINWGDSSFARIEPATAQGWQIRFLRGPTDLGPFPTASIEQAQRYLKRFGDSHEVKLAFLPGKDFRMRPQTL